MATPSSLLSVKPLGEYNQRNEVEHREQTAREFANTYRKNADVVVPFGKKLCFTGSAGDVVCLSLTDGAFTLTINGTDVLTLTDTTALFELQQTLVGGLADAAAQIQEERVVRATDDEAYAAINLTLAADFAAGLQTANALIVAEQEARATADEAMVRDYLGLFADFGAATQQNSAAIEEERIVRADAVSALASMTLSLVAETQALGVETRAELAEERIVRTAADEALAAQSLTLLAEFGAATQENRASIQQEAISRATADEAVAAQSLTLAAESLALGQQNSAAIIVEQVARTTAVDALASQTLTLVAEVNGATQQNAAAIVEEQEARADGDSAQAEYSLTLVSAVRAALVPDRVAVALDFTADSSGAPEDTDELAAGTVENVAGKGDVRQFTAAALILTRGWKPVVAGHTYRATSETRVTVDGTDNRVASGFHVFAADGSYLGAHEYGYDDTSAVVADGWQTFAREAAADDILTAYPTAAFVRAVLFGGRNASAATSGATWQANILRLEDVTEFAGIIATVQQIAETYATDDSGFARLLWRVNVGDNTATIEQSAATGYDDGTWNGSAIKLSANEITLDAAALNLGDDTVFENDFNSFYTETAGYRYRDGGPFGDDVDLLIWYGPDSVTLDTETKTNGVWAIATDGKIYYGGAELGATQFSASISPTSVGYSQLGAGLMTTPLATCTATGGTAPYSYRWELAYQNYGSAMTIDSPNTDDTTFSRTMIAAETTSAYFRCIVRDSAGRIAYAEVLATLEEET